VAETVAGAATNDGIRREGVVDPIDSPAGQFHIYSHLVVKFHPFQTIVPRRVVHEFIENDYTVSSQDR
jgi:hypothetical protein